MGPQTDLFTAAPAAVDDGRAAGTPPGFRYQADFLTPSEEKALVAEITTLDLKPFEFRGYLGLRRVRAFGYRYDYVRRVVDVVEPIPAFLQALGGRVAVFASHPAEAFHQVLVTEYAPGAPIGWHRDKPHFGDIVGVSLLSPCVFRLRRRNGARWDRASQLLEPRSAYVMTGKARHDWEHSIPDMETLRYSVTFRTLSAGFTPPDV